MTGMINIGAWRASSKKYMDDFKRAAELSFNIGANTALGELQSNPPFKSRTGRLLNSVRPYVRVGNLALSVKFAASAPYASYVEHGTPPHTIRPRNGRFLRFYWARVGQVVFARAVRHPGTKPTKFLEKTRDRAAELAMAELARRMPR